MQEIATASINNLRIPQADVPPSEDPIFVLTSSQLKDIISRAIQPLKDELSELKATVASQDNELATVRLKLVSLETLQEQDTTRICLDIAQDRRRLASLENKPSTTTASPRGEKTIARIEKIEEVLKSRGPTSLRQMEHILKISPKEMNRLIEKLDMRRYELHVRPGDAREKVLRLKAQIR